MRDVSRSLHADQQVTCGAARKARCALQQVFAQLTAVRALLDRTFPQMPGAGRARMENNDGDDRQRVA